MPYVPEEMQGFYGGAWVKTARGWKMMKAPEDRVYSPTCERLTARPDLSNTSKEVSIARNVIVTGMKGQRKVSACLSEFLKLMNVEGAVSVIRRKAYLFDLMHLFMKDHLPKMSGTAHREIFKILEMMTNEALETEYCVHEVRKLLAVTLQILVGTTQGWIGSKSVRNRHVQLVQNLLTKLDQHPYYEREEDYQLMLTDLPKECLREIMSRMSDARDIVNLGAACSYMHELHEDELLWERLTQRHFTEKQMMTFAYHGQDIGDSLQWQHLYQKCFRKYGVKKTYTDGLVICSACKTLHWMLGGHTCWSSDDVKEVPYLDPVTPEQLIPMLNL